jgi:hypothetical protein
METFEAFLNGVKEQAAKLYIQGDNRSCVRVSKDQVYLAEDVAQDADEKKPKIRDPDPNAIVRKALKETVLCGMTLEDQGFVETATKSIQSKLKGKIHPDDAFYVLIHMFIAYCQYEIEGTETDIDEVFHFGRLTEFWQGLGIQALDKIDDVGPKDHRGWRWFPADFNLRTPASANDQLHEQLNKKLARHGWQVSEDFRVWQHDQSYQFTARQAEVLKVLAKSYLEGMDSIHEKKIMLTEYIDYTGQKVTIGFARGSLKDLFGSRRDYFDWQKFLKNHGNAFYSLNVPPE